MPHVITASNGGGTVTPLAIEGYSKTLESRSIFHDLLDGGTGFVYVAPRPGSGPLTLLFATRAEAFEAQYLHTLSDRYSLTSSDAPEVGMTYAIDGAVTVEPDESAALWRVQIDYRVV